MLKAIGVVGDDAIEVRLPFTDLPGVVHGVGADLVATFVHRLQEATPQPPGTHIEAFGAELPRAKAGTYARPAFDNDKLNLW